MKNKTIKNKKTKKITYPKSEDESSKSKSPKKIKKKIKFTAIKLKKEELKLIDRAKEENIFDNSRNKNKIDEKSNINLKNDKEIENEYRKNEPFITAKLS